jgi:hypothetical protein
MWLALHLESLGSADDHPGKRAPLAFPRRTEPVLTFIFALHTFPADVLRLIVRTHKFDEIVTFTITPRAVANNLSFQK